jgi:hypothetical protein
VLHWDAVNSCLDLSQDPSTVDWPSARDEAKTVTVPPLATMALGLIPCKCASGISEFARLPYNIMSIRFENASSVNHLLACGPCDTGEFTMAATPSSIPITVS